MPRNISFALTTQQFRDRTKSVTRRIGWWSLKPGDLLCGCRKCMGLRPGEQIERLGMIEVVNVRREPLEALLRTYPPVRGRKTWADLECEREGFPELLPWQFVRMFCEHMKCDPSREVNRIEFRYV
jgi:hypothetical protein